MELRSPWLWLLAVLSFLHLTLAQTVVNGVTYVTANVDGENILVRDTRQPSLYTGDFGDCMGDSSINVTRFDAAFYKDNMTVLFHLAGDTSIVSEGLMMYISVYAYGDSQFELIFNPCNANIASLCPVQSNVSIEANGIIPVGQSDIQNIPSLAYTIPDFEGQAILRIFANSTQQMIGCYSAVITNGASFSHPYAVGSILGIFTFVALVASFATAIYGIEVPTMRSHYAHSMSVLVVFAVWQHIFFTGALSMNWPSVLVAFWSNYAWAGGMIYSESMQNTINSFIGSNKGNTTSVGAASAGSDNNNLGGGYDITKIYRRSVKPIKRTVMHLWRKDIHDHHSPRLERALAKRALANSTEGYSWYGNPVKPGLPLPGNYSGFAGTLGQEDIPASNAFMTGFLWLLILLVCIAAAVAAFKWLLEGLASIKFMKKDRLTYFRTHWLGYTALAVLRTLFIGFFAMMFLTLFQFTYQGSAGVMAIAAIIFIIFFCGMIGVAAYACYYRVRVGNYVSEPDRINLERSRMLGCIPWYRFSRASAHRDDDAEKVYAGSLPFWRVSHNSPETQKSIHDDEEYTKKFGWLAARFRRTRWWFFGCWLVYEFVRACFLAGASGHPMTQVFGLLVVEFLAFVAIIILRPFESQRLNALVIYLLGFSKVATVALSAAFDIRFNIARIPTTVVGIVIIVIQGVLTCIVMIAILVGAATTWMSVKRLRPTEEFRPRNWRKMRERYFKHMDKVVKDLPPEPPAPVIPPPEPEVPKEPYFQVGSVRRVAKIEDEDPDFLNDIGDPRGSEMTFSGNGRTSEDGPATVASAVASPAKRNRAPSIMSQMSYTSLPRTARVHRASWSSRDFLDFDPERVPPMPEGSSAALVSGEGSKRNSAHSRANSLGHSRASSQGHVRTNSLGRPRATSLGRARSQGSMTVLSQLNTQIAEHGEDMELTQSPDAIQPAGRRSADNYH